MLTKPDRRSSTRRARRSAAALLASFALALGAEAALAHCEHGQEPYTKFFRRQECTFTNTGSNPFFSLQPGHHLRLRGPSDEGDRITLWITVLDDTELVNGVMTRVVEEREWENGELVEVSRNFFAICQPTNDVWYFGEDVDIYEDGQIVSHDGAWRAGVDGARPGIIMPGSFLVGSRYYQEVAPDVALDRACNMRMNKRIWTHLGWIHGCVEVLETSPLDPEAQDIKGYCPGIGLVKDVNVRLVNWFPAAPVE